MALPPSLFGFFMVRHGCSLNAGCFGQTSPPLQRIISQKVRSP